MSHPDAGLMVGFHQDGDMGKIGVVEDHPIGWYAALGGVGFWANAAVAGAPSPAGVVDFLILASIDPIAAIDYLFYLGDGTGDESYYLSIDAAGTVGLISRTGLVQKQTVRSATGGYDDGVVRLYHFHVGTGVGTSAIVVNGVDDTGVPTADIAWSGPTGISSIAVGATGAGTGPLLGNIHRAAVHFGAVDPAQAWALVNRSWAPLGLDHVWYLGDGHRDSASTIYDEGVAAAKWDLTAVGTPTLTYGRTIVWRGQAASLDGVNDNATTAFPYTPGTDFTVACRFKQNVAGNDIIWSWDDGTSDNRFKVAVIGGDLVVGVNVGGVVEVINQGTATIGVGSWHLATFRYVAATKTASLWLDNALSYSGAHATPMPALPAFSLGVAAAPLDGVIGDTILCLGDETANIAAWVANPGSPLSALASNVVAEYNRGGEVYDAAGGTVLTNRVGTQVVSLDGVNDYARLVPFTPFAPAGQDFTIAARFRQDVAGTHVIWSWNDGTIANRIQVYISGGNLVTVVQIGGVQEAIGGAAALTVGTWCLATLRYVASTRQVSLWLDTTLSFQAVHANPLPAPTLFDVGNVLVGMGGGAMFDGAIGDFVLCLGDESGNIAAWVADTSSPLSDLASNVIAEYNRGGEVYDAVGGTTLTNRVGTQVVSLDGVNDNATTAFPYTPGTDFTVACRFRQDVAGNDVVWSLNDGTTTNYMHFYFLAGKLATVVTIGGSVKLNAGNAAITVGTWHLATFRYIAATRQVSLWLDNTLSYQGTHATTLPAFSVMDMGHVAGAADFDGVIGDTILCLGDETANIAAWVANPGSPLSALASNVVVEYNRGGEVYDAVGGTAVVNRANPGTYNLTIANGGVVDINGNMAIANGGVVDINGNMAIANGGYVMQTHP